MNIRFEEKSFKVGQVEEVDWLFKGIRFKKEEAFKFAFVLGQLLGLDEVYVEHEDEEGCGCFGIDIRDILHGVDDVDEENKEDNVDN